MYYHRKLKVQDSSRLAQLIEGCFIIDISFVKRITTALSLGVM
ncbi:hypothetical protein [Pseudobutyrivibrio ruminis]|nr:hypothetical protein [Pseudobutyrivibrio ruminis]